jgi:hypothetical protein
MGYYTSANREARSFKKRQKGVRRLAELGLLRLLQDLQSDKVSRKVG